MNQKGFVNATIIVLVIVIAGVIGYFALVKKQAPPVGTNAPITPQTSPPATSQNVSQNDVADDCDLISNLSFRSINKYEVGLGPNGPAMGYWKISFRGNKFWWDHSDVSESGTYVCKNNILRVKFFDRSITAHYDRTEKILTWDGIGYKKTE